MVLLVVGGGDWLAGCRRSVGGYGYTPRGTGVEGGMEGKEGVGLDGSGLLLQRTPVTHSVFLRLCRSVRAAESGRVGAKAQRVRASFRH